MKKWTPLLFLYCCIAAGCSKEDTLQPGDNLVLNGSFEDNGNFSTDGWITSSAGSETDVPGGGGSFSLRINPGASPAEGFADYEITDLTGSKSFSLTCQVKSFGDWPGSLSLKKITAGGATTILGLQASSANTWTQLSLSASTTLATGDKLIVHISSGSTETITPDKYALFDLIELKEQ